MKKTNRKRSHKFSRNIFTYEVLISYKETMIIRYDKRKKTKQIRKLMQSPSYTFKIQRKENAI